MDYFEIMERKSIWQRIYEMFTSFVSIFIKKTPQLEEAPVELTEELQAVNQEYVKLKSDETFDGLKKTYDNYKIGVNPEGGLIAIEKNTGYIKEEPEFVARVRFVALWRKSSFGNLDIKDEENCVKECFGDESKAVFSELSEVIQNQLVKTGNINTLDVINQMKESPYKWGRTTSRRLFRTNAYAETVTNYYRSITPNCKKQTKPTYSLLQALYGLDLDD